MVKKEAGNRQKTHRSVGENVFDTFNVVILILIALVTLYPFLYIVFASFSDPYALFTDDSIFLLHPVGKLQTAAYRYVFANSQIRSGFLNTAFYVVAGTVIGMFISTLGAYVLSRQNVLWKKPILILIMFTMYFSGGLMPTYLTIKRFGMLNTVWAVLLPSAVSTTNMIILRSGFANVPDALVESARIDGASELRILVRIMLPLCVPTIAVISMYYAVRIWNAWFEASIYLTKSELFPVQLVLRGILIVDQTGSSALSMDGVMLDEVIKYAVIVVTVLPIIIIYPFIQRYFVKGVMIGAVKG